MLIKHSKFLAISVIFLLVLIVIPISTSGVSASEDSDECYGFIISVDQHQSNEVQIEISKIINELLKNDIEVYWMANHASFKTKTLEDSNMIYKIYFEKGSFIIPFNERKINTIVSTSILYNYCDDEIELYKLMEPLHNLEVYKLNLPKIAIHNGPDVDAYSYTRCIREAGFQDYDLLTWDEIPEKLNNDDYNVFIWGGGFGSFSKDFKVDYLKGDIQKISVLINQFIKNGGGYVGSCGGAAFASSGVRVPFITSFNFLQSYASKFLKPKAGFIGCDFFANSIFDALLYFKTASYGVVISEMINQDNPVSYGLNKIVPMWHWGGPVIKYCGPNSEPLANYYDFSDIHPWLPGTSNLLKNFLLKRMLGGTSLVSSKLGNGKVVAFGSHPEIYFYADKYSNYTCPIRIVHNAIFYVCSEGPLIIDVENKSTFLDMDIEINAPDNCNVLDEVEFNCTINNGKSPYLYYWDFGDGAISNDANPLHAYLSPSNYTVILIIADQEDNVDIDFFNITVSGESAIQNNPPNKPIISADKNKGKTGQYLRFITRTTDIDDDTFWYRLQENDESGWHNISIYDYSESYLVLTAEDSKEFIWESNQTFETYIHWDEKGTYQLRIKAIDFHDSESEWSEPMEIIIT